MKAPFEFNDSNFKTEVFEHDKPVHVRLLGGMVRILLRAGPGD